MIYVRTKHHIHEASEENGELIVRKDGLSARVKPIKKAKRIQTLCDGFYLDLYGDLSEFWANSFYGNYQIAEKERKEWVEFYSKFENDHKPTVYGFIKTERGFEFVAKTDEKGELRIL